MIAASAKGVRPSYLHFKTPPHSNLKQLNLLDPSNVLPPGEKPIFVVGVKDNGGRRRIAAMIKRARCSSPREVFLSALPSKSRPVNNARKGCLSSKSLFNAMATPTPANHNYSQEGRHNRCGMVMIGRRTDGTRQSHCPEKLQRAERAQNQTGAGA